MKLIFLTKIKNWSSFESDGKVWNSFERDGKVWNSFERDEKVCRLINSFREMNFKSFRMKNLSSFRERERDELKFFLFNFQPELFKKNKKYTIAKIKNFSFKKKKSGWNHKVSKIIQVQVH